MNVTSGRLDSKAFNDFRSLYVDVVLISMIRTSEV